MNSLPGVSIYPEMPGQAVLNYVFPVMCILRSKTTELHGVFYKKAPYTMSCRGLRGVRKAKP